MANPSCPPRIPEDEAALTPDWFRRALDIGGRYSVPHIRDVALENIGAGVGFVGKILRCRLSYQGNDSGQPKSVIVKLPASHPETLQTARRLGLYQREYAFYRQVAPHVPIRSPALLYGDFDSDSHRFVLVLEDLSAMASADQIVGASPQQAVTAVRAAAQLHARFWNRENQSPVSTFLDASSPQRRPLVQAAYQASLPAALDRFGHLFTNPMRRLAEEYGRRMVGHLDVVATGPRTFTHGDFRLDNMFFGDGGGSGHDFAAVDWQVCGIDNGLCDVAYFLSSSLVPQVRRQIEREALAEYHQTLLNAGVNDLTFEDCWLRYRQGALTCLRTPIIAGAQFDFTGDRSRQLAETFLARTLTAIDDLRAQDFLPSG